MKTGSVKQRRNLNTKIDGCLLMVPLKQLQEAGLGACGPLDPPETQVVTSSLQVPHVHNQVLQPQTGSLPNGGELRRPEVKERWFITTTSRTRRLMRRQTHW